MHFCSRKQLKSESAGNEADCYRPSEEDAGATDREKGRNEEILICNGISSLPLVQ